ncbi:MAG: hemolysin family protein [Flavisolibacter sp.]
MIFVLVLVVLILINGYFSAAEIAMVSVKRFRIQQVADKGDKNAIELLSLLQRPEEYLSAIQVGITLVGIIEGLYGGEILQRYLQPIFLEWGLSSWFSHTLSMVLGVGIITYITIIIGELLPKSIALQVPQRMALRITPTFRLFTLIAYPFITMLTKSTHLLLQLFHIKGSENQKLSDADLKSFLSLAYRQGTIEKNEWKLHENIFNLYDQTIGKIMTPLTKVVSIHAEMGKEMAEKILRNSVHNYFPVIDHDNKVMGILCSKDFFMNREKSLEQLIQPACKINESQTAPDLLEKFKKGTNNFGVVVKVGDELTGVVTMHDIGEVLIGKFS